MSCQCHQVGGPFIAEDPDCPVHGFAQTDRENHSVMLLERAEETDDVGELKDIIKAFAKIIDDIY